MKKSILKSALFTSTLFLSSTLFANENISQNHWSIGVGSYGFILANDDDSNDDQDFSGFSITAGHAFNNHFQIRGTYFSLENDSYNAVKSKGYDLMIYGGVGLSKKGFRGYGGAGLFSDKWSISQNNESNSGFQFGGGLGYNWGPTALDFVLTLRQADEYEDFIYESGTYIAMSGNLTISYLF